MAGLLLSYGDIIDRMIAYAIFFYALMFMLGLAMGSFVGAMTWRMKTNRDWVRGRSECEHCHHKLVAIDLIPVFSYLALGGKCRYCHKKIGRSTLVLELAGGLIFLGSTLLFPSMVYQRWLNPLASFQSLTPMLSLAMGLWLVCLVIMMALFVYDLRWRLLPNKLVFPLIVVSLLLSAVMNLGLAQVGLMEWLIALALGMLPITGVYGVLYLLSRGRWIGLGDVKLGIAIGLLITWWGGVLVLFLSNLLASLVSIPGLLKRRINGASEIPFGPFLLVATYLVFLLGWALKNILLVL